MHAEPGWTLLTSYEFGHEADFAEATLAEAGIPVLVKGREAGIWGPGFTGAPSQGLSLWVPDDRIIEAGDLLRPSPELEP